MTNLGERITDAGVIGVVICCPTCDGTGRLLEVDPPDPTEADA